MPALIDCPIPQQDWLKETRSINGTALRSRTSRETEDSSAVDWEEVIDEIVALQSLGDDWDGLGAIAPTPELLASAIGLATLLQKDGMDAPARAVAGTDGTVLLEWQAVDGSYCEVEVDRPFHADVMLVLPGQPAKHWELPTE
jgi:hypothetical protein